jgi:outer membrane lipoprotein-sorting protein
MLRGAGVWGTAAVMVAALALLPASTSAREGLSARQWVEGKLRELLSLRSASWVQSLWERKSGEEQTTRARCIWSGPDQLRLDIEDGFGKGAHLFIKGEELTIRPPGILGAIKIHRRVSDPRFRSLRGRDLRQTVFLEEVQFLLDHWEDVDLSVAENGAAMFRYRNVRDEPVQAFVRLNPLRLIQIEVTEGGEVVERVTYEQIELDPPVDPKVFVP